jgi:hypothetical protein
MHDYILLMHDDAGETAGADTDTAWGQYLEALETTGRLVSCSAVGEGRRFRLTAPTEAMTSHITHYIHLQAESIDEARMFLEWNPVFVAGGTVEIRELLSRDSGASNVRHSSNCVH